MESEKGTIVKHERDKSFSMSLTAGTHIPLEAFRCLIKIAFTVLPESELPKFEQARRWLIEPLVRLVQPAATFVTMLGVPLATPRVTLWCRRTPSRRLPYMLAALGLSQCGFMYPVALCSEDRLLIPNKIVVPVFDLSLIRNLEAAEWRIMNLSATAKETKLNYEIQMSFESTEEIPPDKFWEAE
jgi:hypothetical protein